MDRRVFHTKLNSKNALLCVMFADHFTDIDFTVGNYCRYITGTMKTREHGFTPRCGVLSSHNRFACLDSISIKFWSCIGCVKRRY